MGIQAPSIPSRGGPPPPPAAPKQQATPAGPPRGGLLAQIQEGKQLKKASSEPSSAPAAASSDAPMSIAELLKKKLDERTAGIRGSDSEGIETLTPESDGDDDWDS
jgi:WH2 motif